MRVGTATPVEVTGATTLTPSKVEARRPLRLDRVMPYVLVLPTLLIIGALRIYPLIRGTQYSLTGDGDHDGEWVGLDNFRELWHDERFIGSLRHVGVLLLVLPVFVVVPLLLASLIHIKTPGHRVYRAVYFFPVVLSPVIIGTMFNTVLSADGPFNSLLETLHLPTNDWLGNPDTALLTVVGVQLWSTFGLAVTIFLAGLSTLDAELIEAATLDGANVAQTIRHVIIPSLRPTIQFVVVTTTIGMLTGMFGLLFVMTAGGPFDSTYLPELYIWVKQGRDNRPALAAAASMVLFGLMAVIAVVQIRLLSQDVDE
jgi:multiple sugar transport system permease protein